MVYRIAHYRAAQMILAGRCFRVRWSWKNWREIGFRILESTGIEIAFVSVLMTLAVMAPAATIQSCYTDIFFRTNSILSTTQPWVCRSVRSFWLVLALRPPRIEAIARLFNDASEEQRRLTLADNKHVGSGGENPYWRTEYVAFTSQRELRRPRRGKVGNLSGSFVECTLVTHYFSA
jgi:hypothetical protein